MKVGSEVSSDIEGRSAHIAPLLVINSCSPNHVIVDLLLTNPYCCKSYSQTHNSFADNLLSKPYYLRSVVRLCDRLESHPTSPAMPDQLDEVPVITQSRAGNYTTTTG